MGDAVLEMTTALADLQALFSELDDLQKDAPVECRADRSEIIQSLIKRPLLSFTFHFDGKRPTNRKDKVSPLFISLSTLICLFVDYSSS